ncbi:VanZ family protein [Turicibacter sp. TJ11]|uniref:VanZ family protein n=1 Tax=Turicibacter sp. TJ11 TaxID=2806443 RepID=UPI001F36745B|nr:VanZ family protein [Turicibacter sp. TJ11]
MKKGLLGCFVLVMIGFILYQGTRSISTSLQSSDYLVYKLMNLFEKVRAYHEEELYRLLHVLVRKGAHLFEYAMLGTLLYLLFKCFKQREHNCWIYALFLVLLCATMDEFFQSFVGRTSSVRDVLIDFSGAIIGMSVISLLTLSFGKVRLRR